LQAEYVAKIKRLEQEIQTLTEKQQQEQNGKNIDVGQLER